MPTDNWFTAARNENKKPVVLMQIEDSSAEEQLYSTRSDWEGSVILTNIDTVSQVGNAIGQEILSDQETDLLSVNVTPSATSRFNPGNEFSVFMINSVDANKALSLTVQLRTGSTIGPIIDSVTETIVTGPPESFGGAFGVGIFDFSSNILTGAVPLWFTFTITGNSFPVAVFSSIPIVVPTSGTDCTLTTSTVDMGSIPANPVTLSIDDTLEAGSSILYTAFGGNADPPVNNLGTVVDGDSLTAFRFYRLQADFSSDTGNRGILKQFSLREGLFKFYGTHKDLPFRGVQPYLKMESLTTLSTAIKLDKGISTTGQMTAVLHWVDDVSDFVATRFLRGKDVQFLYGFQELSQADYEPLFTGTWFDYSFDDIAQTITVKVQDILKQFEKIKIPTEEYNASGVKTSTNVVYTKANGVNTITNIFDLLGIRDRYVSPDYATLEGGALSGTDFNVTRTLSKPIVANKLIDELAQTLGLFLVPQGDGTLLPNLFDDTATPLYTLDASKFSPGSVDGNQDEISTRQYTYYNITDPADTDPNDEDKFDNAFQLINLGSEAKWVNEETQKLFFDKWRIGNNTADPLVNDLVSPPQALIDLANRWDGWFADPQITVTVKDLPPEWLKVQPSNIVELNNLAVPVSNQPWLNSVDYEVADIRINGGRQWEAIAISGPSTTIVEPGVTAGFENFWEDMNILDTGLTDGMKFITMKQSFNIRRGIVTLEFRQI